MDGRQRAVIEQVRPQVEAGRFPIKRACGESVTVEADCFADGHDRLRCMLLYRPEGASVWQESPMAPLANDRWQGTFTVTELGRYVYTVEAWVDTFQSWLHDLARREDPKDIGLALQIGADLADAASQCASGQARQRLAQWAAALRGSTDPQAGRALALEPEFEALMEHYPDRALATRYDRELAVVVDPELARFSSWYELFPRSFGAHGKHGTFKDCEAMLPYVAEMGFDVLYLPPIHPIGRINRKGANNTLAAGPDDPGSPWAIGAEEGGHKSIHPALGDMADFHRLVAKAEAHGLAVALDIAFQCAPDHPYVQAHPQWFKWRPDGTIQFAENPPKKYQDIYPFNFESEAWESLWAELKDVFDFWIQQGVMIFRVDNPHTKPFGFWEWVIAEIKRDHPQVIFLSEAFARPKIMYRLAKLGFTQSYNYFPWRNTKGELTQYFTELTQTEVREYFRPNLWPNTPDILTEYLQFGGRPAFMSRLVLAATLGASYGIYGPAFELCDNEPREPGSQEYRDSEKYQLRQWELDREDSLKDLIARVNRIRHDNSALQQDHNLRFHPVDNEELICYSKTAEDGGNVLLVVVNLDAFHTQSGWVDLSLEALGVASDRPYQVHDLLSGARHLWHGRRNYVELDPQRMPAHIFRLRRRVRTEQDFDYFM